MIKEAYVSYEVAKLLKEKGFDEECFGAYTETNHNITMFTGQIKNSEYGISMYTAPTHQMACAWLRENYDIFIQMHRDNQYYEGYGVVPLTEHDKKRGHKPEYVAIVLDALSVTKTHIRNESYEEAVEAALKYTLENLI